MRQPFEGRGWRRTQRVLLVLRTEEEIAPQIFLFGRATALKQLVFYECARSILPLEAVIERIAKFFPFPVTRITSRVVFFTIGSTTPDCNNKLVHQFCTWQ